MILYGALPANPATPALAVETHHPEEQLLKPEEDEEEIDGEQEEPSLLTRCRHWVFPSCQLWSVILIILSFIAPYIATEGTSFDTFVRFVGNKNVAMLIVPCLHGCCCHDPDGKETSRSVNALSPVQVLCS